jgi:hypothetical protein
MISTITFTHGAKTCASEPGKFCHWCISRHFGTRQVCMLFYDEPLYDKDGWLQRCPECIAEFGETE